MSQMTDRQKELLHQAGKHYAATYLLMTIAVDHADMGDRAVSELGMYRNEIKQNAARVQKSFDRFCQDFKKYIAHGDDKVILNDWERLSEEIEKILDLNL